MKLDLRKRLSRVFAQMKRMTRDESKHHARGYEAYNLIKASRHLVPGHLGT